MQNDSNLIASEYSFSLSKDPKTCNNCYGLNYINPIHLLLISFFCFCIITMILIQIQNLGYYHFSDNALFNQLCNLK